MAEFTDRILTLIPERRIKTVFRLKEAQGALFYEFSIDDHVPQDHLLRSIDRFVGLSSIRAHLLDFFSHTDPSLIDPELISRISVGLRSR